jgi:peroxiredoxin
VLVSRPPALMINQAAPDFVAPDLDGQPVRLSDFRGRPVWINFWATWCPPCKTEMPLMEARRQQHAAQGLLILGIDLQESAETVRAWTRDRFRWRFLIDADGALADLYRVEGVPTHVFIDRAGVVRGVYAGELDAAGMDAHLARIITP